MNISVLHQNPALPLPICYRLITGIISEASVAHAHIFHFRHHIDAEANYEVRTKAENFYPLVLSVALLKRFFGLQIKKI